MATTGIVRFLATVGAFALCGAGLAGPAFTVRDACVVCPDAWVRARGFDAAGRAAILDLTNAIAKVTGATLPVYGEGDRPAGGKGPVIYLGDVAAARAAGLAAPKMRNLDSRVKIVPGAAYLYSRTATGTESAVIEFLRRTADFWYLTVTGEDPFTYNPDLKAQTGAYELRPAIYCRDICHGMFSHSRYPTTKPRWIDYSRRLRLNRTGIESRYRLTYLVRHGHSSFQYVPPEKYFKDHPEYFSLRKIGDGKHVREYRNGGQICYSNPEVFDIAYAALERFVEQDRREQPDDPPRVYDFSQQDFSSGYLCDCDGCRKIIAKYNRVPGGSQEGGTTGLQLQFVNRLARKIRVKHPDVLLCTFAYAATEALPVGIVPEDNVIVWVCDFVKTDAHYPLDHPVNALRKKYVTDWAKAAKNLRLWDYLIYGWRDDIDYPFLAADAIASDAKLFRSLGFNDIFLQSDYNARAFHELNYLLAAELYFNPDADVDGLIRTYCRVYGKGADEMYQALNGLRRAMKARPPEKPAGRAGWRNNDVMDELKRRFLAAYALAETPREKARVALAVSSVCWQLMDNCLRRPALFGRVERERQDFKRYRKEYEALSIMEPEARAVSSQRIDDLADLAILRFKDLPLELKDVPRQDLICLDRRSMSGPGRRQDPLSETGWSHEYGEGRNPDYLKGFPLECGLYDKIAKKGPHFKIGKEGDVADGKFRWYRLGTAQIGRDSILWLNDWHIFFRLGRLFIDAEETGEDFNTYEFWASVRAEGPNFRPGATGPDRIYFDRLALRRVKGGNKQ